MRTKSLPAIALLFALVVGGSAQDPETSPPGKSVTRGKVELYTRRFDDPKMKEVIRQQQTAQLKQIYGDFVRQRRLSPQQARQFFDLCAEENMRDLDDGTNFFSGDKDDAGSDGTEAKSSAAKREEIDRKLRLLLGDNEYAEYKAYEKTVSERLALVQIREQLNLAATPLSDDQVKNLLQIMMEEHARTPPVAFDPRSAGSTREKFTVVLEGDNAERYFAAQTDLNQRILNRTGTTLTPEQCEALERFQKQHLDVQKVGIEMAREIKQRRKNGARVPAVVSTPAP